MIESQARLVSIFKDEFYSKRSSEESGGLSDDELVAAVLAKMNEFPGTSDQLSILFKYCTSR